MALTITHSQVAGTGVDPDAVIDGDDWDANHVITGAIAATEVTNTPSGGISSATVQDVIDDIALRNNVTPQMFGATEGGLVDAAAAFQAAIDYLAANGGGTLFVPSGRYLISTTLVKDADNVLIEGVGSVADRMDLGSFTALTHPGDMSALIWGGADGGTILDCKGTQTRCGGGVRNIAFFSNVGDGSGDAAGVGLEVAACLYADFTNLSFNEFKTVGFNVIGVVISSPFIGNVQECEISRIFCFQREQDGAGINFGDDGASTSNASLLMCRSISVYHENGPGITFEGSDNIYLYGVRTFCGLGLAGGNGVIVKSRSVGKYATNNIFFRHLSSNTAPIVQGTSDGVEEPYDIIFELLDIGNATPVPVVGTGAGNVKLTLSNGYDYAEAKVGLAVGGGLGLTVQAKATLTAIPDACAVFSNASSAHTIWENASAASRWRVYVDSSTGDFAIGQLVGSSNLLVGSSVIASSALGSTSRFMGTAANAAGAQSEIVVRKTGIANNSATAIITVTVPNANHNAAIFLDILGHLGTGTDASESSRCATGCIVLSRTTGADTVATAATLTTTQIATVSGGGTLTLAYDVSSLTGASSATQTFTIRLTLVVTGTITDHTAVMSARLLNSLATGVTMAAA